MDALILAKAVRRLEIVTTRNVTELFAGNYKSSFKGQGLEIGDLREYADGDDMRHIDWTATAKQGKPYIKQYRETRELTTLLVMDTSASMDFTTNGKTKKDLALEVAATLLFSALKNNDLFGALIFGNGPATYIPPRKGRTHLLRILRDIIARFDKPSQATTGPDAALARLNALVRKRSVCFIIGDDLPATCRTDLRIANRRHELAFIRVYDPFERGVPTQGAMSMQDPETGALADIDLSDKGLRERFAAIRLARLDESNRMLRQTGVDALDVSTGEDPYAGLLKLFKKRQMRR